MFPSVSLAGCFRGSLEVLFVFERPQYLVVVVVVVGVVVVVVVTYNILCLYDAGQGCRVSGLEIQVCGSC